jgi:hypothetical protein
MEIEAKILTEFLDKVKMTKSVELSECILDFAKDGLLIVANTTNKLGQVRASLLSVKFENYSAIGTVGVNDLPVFIEILERFHGKITIVKTGNILHIKGTDKSVEVELVSEQYIERDMTEPPLEFTDNFAMHSSVLNSIIGDIKLNKDAVLTIELEPGKVIFKNTGKYKFTREFTMEGIKSKLHSGFGQSFVDAVANLDGDLTLYVREDYPIKIKEEGTGYYVILYMAPRVENAE